MLPGNAPDTVVVNESSERLPITVSLFFISAPLPDGFEPKPKEAIFEDLLELESLEFDELSDFAPKANPAVTGCLLAATTAAESVFLSDVEPLLNLVMDSCSLF